MAVYTKMVTPIRKSDKYKYVVLYSVNGVERWKAYVPGYKERPRWQKFFDTEREAAIGVDKHLIRFGKEPVNILKRK